MFAEDDFIMNDEFDRHWAAVKHKELSAQKLQTAEEFLLPVIEKINDSASVLRICDGGCGDGVHALVLSKITKKSLKFVSK